MLAEELRKVIENSLPMEVGKALKERLEQAEKDSIDAKRLRVEATDLEKRFDERTNQLSDVLKEAGDQKASRADIVSRQNLLAVREATIQLKEKHADEKVGIMRGVVKDVFSNNRFKYVKTGEVVSVTQPGKDQYGGSMYPDVTREPVMETVEGEA